MSDDDAIFVAEDRSPLRIYVEPTDVPDRAARLIKKLKKGGADIQINSRDADIVIVGEDIDIRRRTVDAHKDKIILDYKWVQASLKREAAYLARDNWGRFRVIPEGQTKRPISGMNASGTQNAAPVPLAGQGQSSAPQMGDVLSQLSPQVLAFLQQHLSVNGVVQPMQAPAYAQPWTSDPTALLSGPTMLVPVQLQQRILDHMLTLSPSNQFSWQLARLVEQFTKQQATGHAMMSGLSGLPVPNHATHPAIPAYNHSFAPSPAFQQGSSADGYVPADKTAESTSAPVRIKRERERHDRDESSSRRKHRRRDADDDDGNESTSLATAEQSVAPARKSIARPIFVDEKGKPILFWVQHAKWRNQFVPDIQKFGGKIVADIADADYAVLFTQALGSWDYLRTAVELGTPAVRPRYITQCIEKGRVIDSSSFSFEGTSLKDDHGNLFPVKLADICKNGRARVPVEDESSSEEEVAEEEEESEGSGKATAKKAKSNRFTEEELTRASDIVKQLLEENPEIASSVIHRILYQKIPSHSPASWSFKLGGYEGPIERARRRAKAKADAEQGPAKKNSPSPNNPSPASPPSQMTGEPQPPPPEPVVDDEQYVQDLTAIAQQFVRVVKGEYENNSDDEVFAVLTDQVKCQTAPTWQEFFARHQGVVETLVKQFIDMENVQPVL